MPRINLIAERREEQLRLIRLTRNLFFALSTSVGVLITLALFLAAQRLTMTGELNFTESRMVRLQPILDNIDRIKQDTDSLKPKVDTLTAAKLGTTKWRVILQEIAGSIPEDTYLTAINTSGPIDDTTVTLDGTSSTQTVVGEMMTRLGADPLFDRVDLKFTQASISLTPGLSADSGTPSVQFEIAAHIKGAPKPTPAPTEKAKS